MWNSELAGVAQAHSAMCTLEPNLDRVSQQSTFVSIGESFTAVGSSDLANANYTSLIAQSRFDDSVACIHCCTFDGNRLRAENSGGAIYGCNNVSILVNVTSMSNNSAQTSGGRIHIQKNCHVIIESSDFTGNTADYGGVIHVYVFSTAKVYLQVALWKIEQNSS